jgi:pimeloyl-ACP methyl ester carboxylesterase
MSRLPNQKRRYLLGAAALGVASVEWGLPLVARAQSVGQATAASAGEPALPIKRLQPIKQVHAGVLDIGYYEAGPADGPVVLLLHGFPYDIHSYIEVAPILAAKGYRVVVPHLRGYGTTRFLDADTPRSGEQAALGADVIALMDALKIPKAVLAGYDWGGRAACVVAALWPERCAGLLSVNSYLIQDIAKAGKPLPAKVERGFWYQFYFTTERGRAGLAANRKDIARVMWPDNSPTWHFDEATFERSAAAFDNPDYVDVVIHSYRHRLGVAEGYPQYAELQRRLAAQPLITVPTVTLDGDSDGVVPATDGKGQAALFTRRTHHIVKGVGHNVPQEAPVVFAEMVLAVATRSSVVAGPGTDASEYIASSLDQPYRPVPS